MGPKLRGRALGEGAGEASGGAADGHHGRPGRRPGPERPGPRTQGTASPASSCSGSGRAAGSASLPRAPAPRLMPPPPPPTPCAASAAAAAARPAPEPPAASSPALRWGGSSARPSPDPCVPAEQRAPPPRLPQPPPPRQLRRPAPEEAGPAGRPVPPTQRGGLIDSPTGQQWRGLGRGSRESLCLCTEQPIETSFLLGGLDNGIGCRKKEFIGPRRRKPPTPLREPISAPKEGSGSLPVADCSEHDGKPELTSCVRRSSSSHSGYCCRSWFWRFAGLSRVTLVPDPPLWAEWQGWANVILRASPLTWRGWGLGGVGPLQRTGLCVPLTSARRGRCL
ncbi:neural Wiskott-Aldrich syndrome protein-like [Canis lupus familiaris]|uniref:neural Wiskott-Aldrich syndrome protein-like n=1 Tax=Canis lupus dingo TaxID=286419 RepID=UPI000DC6720E|nr:neural Wiskott-Aldrich syndrome protein-like [Canis lupus dingo]XP_038313257.1 neural Wiskott-Aldrich syndrome protein-like [Canis lupus familiaris]XP_038427266.1 neural Wiskott-Aldrich syndrome protein-like [Canis lupus familiaris]